MKIRTTDALLMLTVSLMISGCGERAGSTLESGSDHTFELIRSQRVPIALNRGGPRYPGELVLRQDLVIGEEGGPEEYILFSPTNLVVDDEGRMYQFDWDRKGILVYDRDGTWLRTLGREGQGPGEFDRRGGVFLFGFPDGTIDAMASAGTRWMRWTPDGELLFDHRAFNTRSALGMTRFPTRSGETNFMWQNSVTVQDTMDCWRIYQLDAGARFVANVATYPLGLDSYVRGVYRGNSLGISIPFISDLIVARGPNDLFAVTMGDSAVFDLYDVKFQHYLTVRWDALPTPLTREQFLDAWWEMPFNDPDNEDDPGWGFYQTLEPPACKPVIYNLIVDDDDRIWARLWGDLGWPIGWGPKPESVSYAVFSGEGEYLYRIEVPFEIKAINGQFLYEVYNDGENTPQLRRYSWEIVQP
ncbi:6-bladed beta-propeller [Gemmatimonadota bacterium]